MARKLKFDDPEPWEGDVSLSEVLSEVCSVLKMYVVLPEGAEIAIALWIVHVWCLEAFYISPILRIESPVKACGKTTLMICIGDLLPRNFSSANITPATLFRLIDEHQISIGIDEVDVTFKKNAELISLVNSGYTKKTSQVPRCQGDNFSVVVFSSWGGKVLAGIGKLPSTTDSRSIKIILKKKKTDERVSKLSLNKSNQHDSLRRKLAKFQKEYIKKLQSVEPNIPAQLGDREADNWHPLLSIAEIAGEGWPKKAMHSALALSGITEDDDNATYLLFDIKELFEQGNEDRISTEDILSKLSEMENRPWPEYINGLPMSARQLAKILNPFGIKPRNINMNCKVLKGYYLSDFKDAFDRYLSATTATSLDNKELEKT